MKTAIALPTSTLDLIAPSVTASLPPFTATQSATLSEHGDSFSPSVSANGRWVAFVSQAEDLTEDQLTLCRSLNGQAEYCANVFIYDHINGTVNLVSAAPDGTPANGNCSDPRISADGHWVVFASEATNLARGKTDRGWAIYVYSLQTGNTELVRAPGHEATISGDGRYIAFESNGSIFVLDRQANEIKIVGGTSNFAQPGGISLSPEISTDGRWLAFWSWDGNLVPGDTEVCALGEEKHSCGDIFLLDRDSDIFTRIVVGAAYGLGMGKFTLSLSEDGLWLAYGNRVYNRQTTNSEPLCGVELVCGGILSADGNKVVFWAEEGYHVYDRFTGEIDQVNVAIDGQPGNGKYVDATDSVEGTSFTPGFSISADGRWVAFSSTDSNLVADDVYKCDGPRFQSHNCYDVFLYDQAGRQIYWISKAVMR